MLIIKGYIFALALIMAAYHDADTKEISDAVHMLILLTALIRLQPVNAIAGLTITMVPFLIVALLKEGSIGGGDVKLMGACGFLLGVPGGLLASAVGLALAIVVNLVLRKGKTESFALAPYLAVGSFAAYLIFR